MNHAGGQNETSVEVLKLDASEFRSNYDMTKSNLQTLRSEELLGSEDMQARQNNQHRSNQQQYSSMLEKKPTPNSTEDVADF